MDLSNLANLKGHTEIEISAKFKHLRRFFPILSLSRGSFLPLATHLNFGVLTVSLLSLHRDFDLCGRGSLSRSLLAHR